MGERYGGLVKRADRILRTWSGLICFSLSFSRDGYDRRSSSSNSTSCFAYIRGFRWTCSAIFCATNLSAVVEFCEATTKRLYFDLRNRRLARRLLHRFVNNFFFFYPTFSHECFNIETTTNGSGRCMTTRVRGRIHAWIIVTRTFIYRMSGVFDDVVCDAFPRSCIACYIPATWRRLDPRGPWTRFSFMPMCNLFSHSEFQ